MQTIWGFDLGVTSIGFAVIRHEAEQQAGEVLRLGVRIFPEARNGKLEPATWHGAEPSRFAMGRTNASRIG